MNKKREEGQYADPMDVMGHSEISEIQKVAKGDEITYTEVALDHTGEPINKKELKAFLDREQELPRVVVKCNRETGEWHLFRDDKPYKSLRAAMLINVSFSCEWQEGEDYHGCGGRSNSGEYVGYAAGNLLPVATPMTVPKEGVTSLYFDPDDGGFYDPATGRKLMGSGYLILKADCSSEYVGSTTIGAVKQTKNPK